MSYSIDSLTANCYDGTTCLINKLNIRNENQLSVIENGITLEKATILLNLQIPDTLDFEYYKRIHKILFEDIYDWAGKLRTVNISKKGTAFCNVDFLEDLCQRCFERLKNENYFRNLKRNIFIEEIVDFYYTTNMLHPFREGNGRTQRIFITQLIRFNGYDIDFSQIDKDELMIATIQSASGITDNLKILFDKNIL